MGATEERDWEEVIRRGGCFRDIPGVTRRIQDYFKATADQNAKRQATQRFRRINYLAEEGYDAGKIEELIVGNDIARMNSSQIIDHLDRLKAAGVILPKDTEPYSSYSIKHLRGRIKVITEGLEAYFCPGKSQQ